MYKAVIGLEVHCELKTNSKNFSSAENSYSTVPNSNVSPVDLGYPGILPVVNKNGVKNALKMALAFNCTVPEYLTFERKNYFYPDLPKGYQITQVKHPIGTDGYVMINHNGVDKKILIHDTHLEEDTASLDHYDDYSLLDYNRCGVPLLETVTEPCIESAEEAVLFLETLKSIFVYCGVSEARNDLGQIRCDVNVSLMEEGSNTLGTRVEMKNVSSFGGVKLAIEAEIKRQTELLKKGEKIIQETRRFDEETMMTYPLREKVDAVDYKYYTEPNIPPVKISKDFIDKIKKEIPVLPHERINNYISNYNLSRKEAITIVKDKKVAEYFEEMVKIVSPEKASNYLTNILLGILNKLAKEIDEIVMTATDYANLILLVEKGNISIKQAKEVINTSLEENILPIEIIKKNNIMQITDEEEIRTIVLEVIKENNKLIEDYKNGKRVFDYFIGQIMKKTKGKANPSISSSILKEELDKC